MEYNAARTCDKVIRSAVEQSGILTACPAANNLFEALRQLEPGSVVMRMSKSRRTVILLGKDFQVQPRISPELREG
jgi:hypothetical protein